ncbi:NUDIX hydrolase [Arthrobacter sunyaminii]|uniref:NUDIX hydrolase n=1 Tax=Arthrobacter sunyaminii TaxID=2816859 RepID=UPI001A9494A6|nr:NUDIX domain-containing protein [Arthrobacter sunyaminii]MBO0895822.1 NUDIX domain-containing protein [Arthrobacter sunyaminii]
MSGDDEWWDILDSGGTRTGEMFRRGAEALPSGSFHLVVAVGVQREDGAVLLTQRAANKEFPFSWEFPGGSALAGESSADAASRELREESGLNVEPSALTPIGRFAETSALLDFYVARVRSNARLALQRSEVTAAEWVIPEVVERRLAAGLMADPWIPRLDTLWPSIKRALSVSRSW